MDSITRALVDFLVQLLNIPSPTGYHAEVMPFLQQAFGALNIPGLRIEPLPKGDLRLFWQGTHNNAPRGVTAHADTLGYMVKEIKPSGNLKVTNIGGITWQGSEFENMTVRTFTNDRYRGTLIPVNPSAHVNPDLATQARNGEMMELRLDFTTSSSFTTRALGIEVGDFVFVDPRVEVVPTGFIRSRFLDDKACVAILYAALMTLRDTAQQPLQDTTFHIANYEEVGHGGAAAFPLGLHEVLALDMGALGDGQNGDEYSVSICAKDSAGPYHFDMVSKLRTLANQLSVPYKMDIYPFYSSDGSAYWRAGGTARVGLMGPGIASSHSYERTHVDSLRETTRLLVGYLVS